jgi:thiol-disulfide isomerase/thioredoxin
MDLSRYNTFTGGASDGIYSKVKTSVTSFSNNKVIMYLLIAVIVFAILYAVYYYYYSNPQMGANYQPNHEQVPENPTSGGESELLFFYAEWCPHCKTAKPIWESLKSEYANKTINGSVVTFTEVNCTEETAEVEKMMNQYNVEGYPTFKLLKNGQVIEYDAKPNRETLVQFLNTVA